jgi:four helix bundle protein
MTTNQDLSDFPPRRNYQDLIVWKKSISLVGECHDLVAKLPDAEDAVLRDQILRAVVRIPANIAAGHDRGSSKAFLRHLDIARGRLKRLETLLEIARRVGYLTQPQLERANLLTAEIDRMLVLLMEKLGARRWD